MRVSATSGNYVIYAITHFLGEKVAYAVVQFTCLRSYKFGKTFYLCDYVVLGHALISSAPLYNKVMSIFEQKRS